MSDPSDGPSPWSSDSVPMSPPSVVLWDEDDAAVRQSGASSGNNSEGSVPVVARSRRPFLVAALAVVAVVGIGLIVWPDDRTDEGAESPPPESDAPPTTLETLPDRVPDADEAVGSDDDGGTSSSGAETSEIERVDLPAPVAAIEAPTELIVQTVDRRIHTISLPSGTVRTVDLGTSSGGDGFGGGRLIAGPDAAMFASYDAAPFIIPRSGVPIAVDLAQFGGDAVPEQITPYGWIFDESGEAGFVVAAYQNSTDTQQSFFVSADGTRVAPLAAQLSSFDFPIAAQGVQIVNDAGGAYRLATDGTAQRLSDGAVIAASQTEMLVRRCDDARTCQFVVRPIDAGDGGLDERVVDVPEALGGRYFGVSLSPDGTAIAFSRYGETQQRVIVELAGGEIAVDSAGDFGVEGAWAQDGSGEFTSTNGPGIAFLDRASGESFVFGEALGQIMAVAARYPESELVDTSIPTSPVGFSTAPRGEIGIDLLTTGRIGALTLVEIGAATASSWNAPSSPGSKPPRLFADGPEALVLSSTGISGYLATYGTTFELPSDSLPKAPVFVGPGGHGLWVRNASGDARVDQIAIAIDGGPSARAEESRLTVDNATLLGDDGAGSLVFERGGSIYISSGGDPALVTTGELIALGTTGALVRECDEQMSCALEVFDRRSGERSSVGVDSVVHFAEAADGERAVSLAGSMSPDGNVALVSLIGSPVVDSDGERDPDGAIWAFVDLTTSEAVVIDVPTDQQPIIWNADSTYAVFTSDGSILVFERSTQSIITVTGVTDVRGITAVGPDFRPGEPDEATG